MKLNSDLFIDNRMSDTLMHAGANGQQLLVPGASTCTIASSSCSCGAVNKK